ncbi:hypothetical protein SteCoe_39792 [Stentor coeruleus]|uniref:Uncharacterized protein n=1 Tax=Stentor coeruleus TaxID=5963 RepID=A0A1R2AKG6_9CILI|nr:hypothetical protein SteCoe_39792 [Stentor coeruleus]
MQDMLKIAISILFVVLTHELSNFMRLKYGTPEQFSVRTPEKFCREAGLYIDRVVYGNNVQDAGINSGKFTIQISEKILNLEELTQEEALMIFPLNLGRNIKRGVLEFIDVNDEEEEKEYYKSICGRPIQKKVVS